MVYNGTGSIPNELYNEAVNQLIVASMQTLHRFPNDFLQPASEFKKVVDTDFYDFFENRLWDVIERIFQDRIELEKLFREHLNLLFEYKIENDGIFFKKKQVFDENPDQQKIMEELGGETEQRNNASLKEELMLKNVEIEKLKRQLAVMRD